MIQMELLGIKEVMALLSVGRPTATRIMKESGRAVKRPKNGKLLISREALKQYLEDGE